MNIDNNRTRKMKEMKNVWTALAFIVLLIPSFQSCDLDSDYAYPWMEAKNASIATIHAVDENKDEFYFLLDGGKKLYPGDLEKISRNYDWKEGQRAIIYFNMLKETAPGYDYSAEMIYIQNILTKGVIPMTEETADSIGDDKINIVKEAWFGGGHLNIEFEYLGTTFPKELHMLNLVRNETGEGLEDGDYIVLEFRHNAFDDYPDQKLSGIVSFRPPFTNSVTAKPYKGIKLRVNTIYEGIKYVTVDFTEEGRSSITGGVEVQ